MYPEGKEKTVFVTTDGLIEVIMLFGLCNAPSTFERFIDVILSGLNGRFLALK